MDGSRFIATGSEDGSIVLYDANMRTVSCQMEGHSMPVISIDVAKQNKVVSGSADGTIKLWEYYDRDYSGQVAGPAKPATFAFEKNR